jgi:hypothetical protein
MVRKKKAEKVEEVTESTAAQAISPEEQSVMEEQARQKRVAECTAAVQKALQASNCDLDITVILKAGQVIPRVAIMPIEVLQAQRAPQNRPV